MLIWSSVEVMVTVLCSSIPVLRAFYVQVFRGGKESSYRNHASNTYGSNGVRGLGNSKGYALDDLSSHARANRSAGAGGMRAGGGGGGAYAGDDMFKTNIEGTGGFQTNSSEESILGGQGGHPAAGMRGITRTDHIVVSYGTKDSRSVEGDVV